MKVHLLFLWNKVEIVGLFIIIRALFLERHAALVGNFVICVVLTFNLIYCPVQQTGASGSACPSADISVLITLRHYNQFAGYTQSSAPDLPGAQTSVSDYEET